MSTPCGCSYIMLSCGLSRQNVGVVHLAGVVVIRSAGWVLEDVLQVVRRWVRWWNVIDGEWAQRWALWRLWLAEIGRQRRVSTFLTGRHYSPLWFSGVLSHSYSQLVCFCECVRPSYDPSEAGGFLSKSLAVHTDVRTRLHSDGWMDGWLCLPIHKCV